MNNDDHGKPAATQKPVSRVWSFLRRITGIQLFGFGIDVAPQPDLPPQSSGQQIPLPLRLLTIIWAYPLLGESERSWAVKESAVLRGRLGAARDQPGLGCAIVTTELAYAIFGSAAESRIHGCIGWALSRRDSSPPHYILAENIDTETSESRMEPDFRHTLAFAVILARAKKHYGYLESYVHKAIETQQANGGWPEGKGVTVSQVYTVMYAVELLHIVSADKNHPHDLRRPAATARDKGIQWLVENRTPSGMWVSGVLKDVPWDDIVTTAWILHRLLITLSSNVEGWRECIERALANMIHRALDPTGWSGTEAAQRQRAEARIAAAAARAHRTMSLDGTLGELVQTYYGAWKDVAARWAANVSDDDMDVATAAFLVDALVETDEARVYGRMILSAAE